MIVAYCTSGFSVKRRFVLESLKGMGARIIVIGDDPGLANVSRFYEMVRDNIDNKDHAVMLISNPSDIDLLCDGFVIPVWWDIPDILTVGRVESQLGLLRSLAMIITCATEEVAETVRDIGLTSNIKVLDVLHPNPAGTIMALLSAVWEL